MIYTPSPPLELTLNLIQGGKIHGDAIYIYLGLHFIVINHCIRAILHFLFPNNECN